MHTPKRQWNLNFNLYFGSSGWIKGMAYSCRFWLSNIKFTILNNQFENKFLCRISARQEINTARYNRQIELHNFLETVHDQTIVECSNS